MQKFVTELEKIKAAHAKLAEMLDKQITEVEGKVSSETEKIKEMVGLIEKAKSPKKEPKEKKADKSATKSKHEKGESKEDFCNRVYQTTKNSTCGLINKS
jgi:hypothetical protein